MGRCGCRCGRRHALRSGGPRHGARRGAIGAAGGHIAKGISRSDVKELGDLIDSGEAALLVIGESTLEEALDKATLKAEKQVAKQLDVSTDDVDAAVKEATGEVT